MLRSGALAIAYNNMSGETKGDLRNVLAISLSEDGGRTFPFTRLLEKHPPSVVAEPPHSAAGQMQPAGVASSRGDGVGPTSCDCYSCKQLRCDDCAGCVSV
eukprot:COSAG01_NODE_5496_length_4225_cov_1.890936_5_plen_101_part_00